MKLSKNFILAVVCLAIGSCANSGAKSPGDSAAASDQTVSAEKASFSCQINGKQVTGNGVGGMQLQNAAFLYPDKENGDQLLFFLVSTKDRDDDKPDYSFRIKCPAKVGTFNRKPNDDFDAKTMPSVTLDFKTGDFARYVVGGGTGSHDIASITFTSITATRVTGTFHAVLSLSADTRNGKVQTVLVSNGTFDIPFSTGTVKPE